MLAIQSQFLNIFLILISICQLITDFPKQPTSNSQIFEILNQEIPFEITKLQKPKLVFARILNFKGATFIVAGFIENKIFHFEIKLSDIITPEYSSNNDIETNEDKAAQFLENKLLRILNYKLVLINNIDHNKNDQLIADLKLFDMQNFPRTTNLNKMFILNNFAVRQTELNDNIPNNWLNQVSGNI